MLVGQVVGKGPLYQWHSSPGPAICSKSLSDALYFLLAEVLRKRERRWKHVAVAANMQLQLRQAGLDLTCNQHAMGTWH